MKSESEKLDIITAYKELGSYRGAADLCGTSLKTVARVVAAFEADGSAGLSKSRAERIHNYEDVRELVAAKVAATAARISAKRLLPVARAAGHEGRTATSGGWSLRPRRPGDASTHASTAVVVPGSGRRERR